jgi:hypothetical protein
MINLTKSQPPPASLAHQKQLLSGTYRQQDVYDRLRTDFHGKCYLCEYKSTSINIEHFKPHKGVDRDLEFDWDNLFLACGHCNLSKGAKYDTILDCTNPSHRILDWIHFKGDPFPKSVVVIKNINDTHNPLINNTVELLNLVYEGNTPGKKIESEMIKDALCEELYKFLITVRSFYESGRSASEKESLRAEIRRFLSPETIFTAFKRWVIKDNVRMLKDFGDLL